MNLPEDPNCKAPVTSFDQSQNWVEEEEEESPSVLDMGSTRLERGVTQNAEPPPQAWWTLVFGRSVAMGRRGIPHQKKASTNCWATTTGLMDPCLWMIGCNGKKRNPKQYPQKYKAMKQKIGGVETWGTDWSSRMNWRVKVPRWTLMGRVSRRIVLDQARRWSMHAHTQAVSGG